MPLSTKSLKPIHIFVALVIGTVLFSLFCSVFVIPTHVDIAWYIHLASKWIDGQKLYVDLIDVNPPLVVLLSTPAVLMSKIIPVSAVALFKLQTICLSLVISFLFYTKTKERFPHNDLLVMVVTYILLLLLVFIPGRQLGQREHYVLLFSIPYLLSLMYQNQQQSSASYHILSGALLSLAVGLKPFYILLPLLLELLLHKSTIKSRRHIGLITLTVGLIIYGLSILLIWPSYLETGNLALLTYATYHIPSVSDFIIYFLVLFFAFVLFLADFKHTRLDSPQFILLLSSSIFFFVGLYQNKGWWNHFYPAMCLVLICMIFFIHSIRTHAIAGKKIINPIYTGLLFATVFAFTIFTYSSLYTSYSYYHFHNYNNSYRETIAAINEYASGQPVILYSMSMNPHFLLINNSKAVFVSRFACFWFIPEMILQTKVNDQEVMHIREYTVNSIVADLQKYTPVLLLFDNAPEAKIKNEQFNFLEFLSQSEEFNEIFQHYKQVPFPNPHLSAYLLNT